MKKLFIWLWNVALAPFYYTVIAAASVIVLLSGGITEFKSFWRKNA